MIQSLSQAYTALAIFHARRSPRLISRAARTIWKCAPPSVAILALALAGCTHNENATTTSTSTSAPQSIIGSWVIPNAKPLGGYVGGFGGVSFKADGTGTWTTVVFGPDRKIKRNNTPDTWTDVGGNKVRIIVRSDANEMTYAFDRGHLVLTPAQAGASGYVFDRVKE